MSSVYHLILILVLTLNSFQKIFFTAFPLQTLVSLVSFEVFSYGWDTTAIFKRSISFSYHNGERIIFTAFLWETLVSLVRIWEFSYFWDTHVKLIKCISYSFYDILGPWNTLNVTLQYRFAVLGTSMGVQPPFRCNGSIMDS